MSDDRPRSGSRGCPLLLAALLQRRELDVAELADPARLDAVHGPSLAYPAGEALVDAMVRLYEPEAIARLVRSFADARLPLDLRRLELWHATYPLAGMDLDAVIDEFEREVARHLERHREEIARRPRPRVRVVESEGFPGVQVLVDRERPTHTRVLRFKPEPDSRLELLESVEAVPLGDGWPARPGPSTQ